MLEIMNSVDIDEFIRTPSEKVIQMENYTNGLF